MKNYNNFFDIKKDQLSQEKIVLTAKELLEKGGIVIFPTDTVFGVLSKNKDKIYEFKQRPSSTPFQILLTIEQAEEVISHGYLNNPVTKELLKIFWPGKISFVLETIYGRECLRVPDHQLLLTLLQNTQPLVFASSLNLHGQPEINTPDEIINLLSNTNNKDIVAFYEEIPTGKASSVVELRPFEKGCEIVILRESAITINDIYESLKHKFTATKTSHKSIQAIIKL